LSCFSSTHIIPWRNRRPGTILLVLSQLPLFQINCAPRFTWIRAAEVCSAEATELPVWKRPPVSVANGLCHPWALDPGSATPEGPRLPGMTQLWGLVCFVSGLGGCPKRRYGKRRYFVQAVAEPPCSTFPGHFQKTGSRVSHPGGAPSARDDTVFGWCDCFNDILSHLYQLYFPIYILLILSILLSAFYNLPFHLS